MCIRDSTSDSVVLPFDLEEVIQNLRLERYTRNCQYGSSENGLIAWLYYAVRPLLPVAVRSHLQRLYLGDWSKIVFPNWPVDHTVEDVYKRQHPESSPSGFSKLRQIPGSVSGTGCAGIQFRFFQTSGGRPGLGTDQQNKSIQSER